MGQHDKREWGVPIISFRASKLSDAPGRSRLYVVGIQPDRREKMQGERTSYDLTSAGRSFQIMDSEV